MGVKTTTPRRVGRGKTANGDASAPRTSLSALLGSRAGALAGAVGLALSATAVALPAVASADEAGSFDIWNLTSTALNITGYSKWGTYYLLPPDRLPTASIPLGKNLHLVMMRREEGVVTSLAGSQPAQQGGTQTWKVYTALEDYDPQPMWPMVHMVCTPGDSRIAACGVTSGFNVQALADAPGTAITVPSSDPQRQAAVKSAYCDHPYRSTLQIKCTDTAGARIVIAGNTTWTLQGYK